MCRVIARWDYYLDQRRLPDSRCAQDHHLDERQLHVLVEPPRDAALTSAAPGGAGSVAPGARRSRRLRGWKGADDGAAGRRGQAAATKAAAAAAHHHADAGRRRASEAETAKSRGKPTSSPACSRGVSSSSSSVRPVCDGRDRRQVDFGAHHSAGSCLDGLLDVGMAASRRGREREKSASKPETCFFFLSFFLPTLLEVWLHFFLQGRKEEREQLEKEEKEKDLSRKHSFQDPTFNYGLVSSEEAPYFRKRN